MSNMFIKNISHKFLSSSKHILGKRTIPNHNANNVLNNSSMIPSTTVGGTGTIIYTTTRSVVTKSTGEYLPQPTKVPYGLLGVVGTVSAGLLLGAAISKNIASFLEENELFVPSDDDDDD